MKLMTIIIVAEFHLLEWVQTFFRINQVSLSPRLIYQSPEMGNPFEAYHHLIMGFSQSVHNIAFYIFQLD